MPDDDLEANLAKLTAAVEAQAAAQKEAYERIERAAARAAGPRQARAAASQKMRGYHEQRKADPSLPRSRTLARGEQGEEERDGS